MADNKCDTQTLLQALSLLKIRLFLDESNIIFWMIRRKHFFRIHFRTLHFYLNTLLPNTYLHTVFLLNTLLPNTLLHTVFLLNTLLSNTLSHTVFFLNTLLPKHFCILSFCWIHFCRNTFAYCLFAEYTFAEYTFAYCLFAEYTFITQQFRWPTLSWNLMTFVVWLKNFLSFRYFILHNGSSQYEIKLQILLSFAIVLF